MIRCVDRIATGEMTLFTTTSGPVYHMESDLYIPGNAIYIDGHSIKTSNGTGMQNIAGKTRVVSTLVKSDFLFGGISQDEQSGDVFIISNQILRYIY